MLLINLFLSTMLTCEFLAAVSHASLTPDLSFSVVIKYFKFF
jgi:hypothetical protein